MTGLTPLVGAIVLVVFGGVFAAIDAAINTVSIARVDELIRDERPGAVRLAKIIRNRPQYVNLVVLLRVICEASATVLLVDYLDDLMTRGWALVSAAAIMVVVSFVAWDGARLLSGERLEQAAAQLGIDHRPHAAPMGEARHGLVQQHAEPVDHALAARPRRRQRYAAACASPRAALPPRGSRGTGAPSRARAPSSDPPGKRPSAASPAR